MSKVAIKNRVLINSNKRYFRTGAEKIVIGTYGKKEKGILQSNYLYPHHDVKFDKADVSIYGPYVLDTEKTKKGEFDIPVNTPVANSSVKVDFESMKNHKVKFIQLYITPKPLIDSLNSDESVLKYLQLQGKKARIVDCIYVAIEADFFSSIDINTDVEAKSTTKGVEISLKLKNGGSSQSKFSLAPNTTIAYGLAEPIWNGSKTLIEGFKPDLKGAG